MSSKFGFTKFEKDDYQKWKSFGRLIPNGTLDGSYRSQYTICWLVTYLGRERDALFCVPTFVEMQEEESPWRKEVREHRVLWVGMRVGAASL